MATAALRRAMTAFTRPPDPADADLLRRFADNRSEDAFAALVRRHGPLVLGVCRRVVPDRHLADDAFQAAFVVLARRAGGIDPTRPLGPWLYGVALRVALRARTMLGKRRKREHLAAAVPEVPHPPPAVDDATAVLDEEIAKLSPAARDAVILCELQGLTRREAAAKLGIAEGTLSSRLASARKTLAAKLQSRGVVLSVALASAAVLSPELASAAVGAGTGAVLSSVVTSLADGASAMTLFTKLKLATATAVFAMCAMGYGLWPAGETSAAPVPKESTADGLIWVYHPTAGELIAYTSLGKVKHTVQVSDDTSDRKLVVGITHDGRQAILAVPRDVGLRAPVFTLHLLPLFEPGKAVDTKIEYRNVERIDLSRDGKTFTLVRVIQPDRMAQNQEPVIEQTRYDLTTFKEVAIPEPEGIPKTYTLHHEFANGDRLVSRSDPLGTTRSSFHLLPADGGKRTPLTGDHEVNTCLVSPDDRRLLITSQHPTGDKRTGSSVTLHVIDRETGEDHQLAAQDAISRVTGLWSPDGKRVVYHWYERRQRPPNARNNGGLSVGPAQVVVCDADGGNPTVLLKTEGKSDTDFLRLSNWGREQPVLVGWTPAPQKVKAPVPKGPPPVKLPPKLDRPPPAPLELAKELAGWDSTYRHQSEEKFAELEKRAEELAKEYTDPHDQARIWYTVAHVAAQSVITKHVDRVRKYAEKCLKVSRDPLDRAYLHSYLASCEELGKGEFADRRRKAADWLFAGYVELLAQELPDEKAEPPATGIRDLSAPPAVDQAKRKAYAAALEHSHWVNEQVSRRDVLVMHFRNLYEPLPQAHGHGPDGPDELRKLAEAKLPTDDDVTTLLKRVLPNHKWDEQPKAKPPVKEPIKAPVPVVKENAMGLLAKEKT